MTAHTLDREEGTERMIPRTADPRGVDGPAHTPLSAPQVASRITDAVFLTALIGGALRFVIALAFGR